MAGYTDCMADLEKETVYKLAVELVGFKLSARPKNKAALNNIIEAAKKALAEYTPSDEQLSKLSDEQKEVLNSVKQPKKEKSKKESTEKVKSKETKRDGKLKVGAIPEPSPEYEWIKEKRQFWKKEFSPTVSHLYEEENEDDLTKTSLKFNLSKDGVSQGEIVYHSKTSCAVSKDSKLVMYEGLVADALKNNLSLTFGKSLDETQKLMLLAAALKNDKTYKNGDKLELVGAPKIDAKTLESEAFQAMDPEAQKIIKAEIDKQIQAQKAKEIQEKLQSVMARLQDDNKNNTLSKEERYELRKEQLNLMKQAFNADPNKEISEEQKAADIINAKRMGIIKNDVTTQNGTAIQESKTYTERKNAQNPYYQAYLKARYGKDSK